MNRQLGANPGANHETLMGVRGDPGSANNEVRFGEIKGVIGTNEVPSDNISPQQDQWGQGPIAAAEQWNCIEVGFLGDSLPHKVNAWVNGELVHSIDDTDQWNNGAMSENWLERKI